LEEFRGRLVAELNRCEGREIMRWG
jgi:hypothetical protein